jgi:hypothetical protein
MCDAKSGQEADEKDLVRRRDARRDWGSRGALRLRAGPEARGFRALLSSNNEVCHSDAATGTGRTPGVRWPDRPRTTDRHDSKARHAHRRYGSRAVTRSEQDGCT